MVNREKAGYRLAALLGLACFLLACVLARQITVRYGVRADLTENQLYHLSDETRRLVSSLDTDVRITVLNAEAEFPLLPGNLLAEYVPLSSRISLTFCDPYLDPLTVSRYGERGYDVALNDIVVEARGRICVVALEELYELSADGESVAAIRAEQKITSAIYQAAVASQRRVLFTDGHGEQPSASLMALLEENGCSSAYAALSVLGLEEDADMLVICSPKQDFMPDEIEAVGKYLEAGGRAMVFLSPDADAMGNLAGLLGEWGVEIGSGVVHEPRLNVDSNEVNVAATYISHPINAYFSNNRYYVVAPSCVPLTQRFISLGQVKTMQVLGTSVDAWAQSALEWERVSGPFVLAMTSERTSSAGGEPGRLLTVGSGQMYADDLMQTPSVANRAFLMQCMRWLLKDDTLISIPAKEMGDPYLPVTAGEARAFSVLLTGGIALAWLCAGLIVILRRRNL